MINHNLFLIEGKPFTFLKSDQDIFILSQFLISPTWEKDKEFKSSCVYDVKDYQLYLKDISVTCDRSFPDINGVSPIYSESSNNHETVIYENVNVVLNFTGGIIVGSEYLKEYDMKSDMPCICYEKVLELIFKDGKLVTSIDHSKAMLRIRKNLDLGYRNLDNNRDIRCIKHFIKSSFVGYYEHPGKMKKKKLRNIHNYINKLRSLTPFSAT